MTRFFDACDTLDELKKAYHAAAMKYHADRGGVEDDMKAINAEYETRFQAIKQSHNSQDTAARATSESTGDFVRIIDHLLRLDGLEVELCGRWLWIGGNTRANKEHLKACGCRWSKRKGLWSWHFAEDGDTRHRGTKTMAQIRSKYGSTRFTAAAERDALPQRKAPF